MDQSTAPHSPRRHQKLNLRMKSFSLDESGEHFHHGHHGVGGSGSHSSHGHPHGHHRLTQHRSSNPNAVTTTSSSGTLNSGSAHNSQASSYCQCNHSFSSYVMMASQLYDGWQSCPAVLNTTTTTYGPEGFHPPFQPAVVGMRRDRYRLSVVP